MLSITKHYLGARDVSPFCTVSFIFMQFLAKLCQTRMHSSRMYTVRCSGRPCGAGVWPGRGCLPGGCLLRGVSVQGGVCPGGSVCPGVVCVCPRGCLPEGVSAQEVVYPPGQTDTCETVIIGYCPKLRSLHALPGREIVDPPLVQESVSMFVCHTLR